MMMAKKKSKDVTCAGVEVRTNANIVSRLGPEMLDQCERVINKVMPACVAFHKPSFIKQLRNNNVDSVMVNALLCTAAR